MPAALSWRCSIAQIAVIPLTSDAMPASGRYSDLPKAILRRMRLVRLPDAFDHFGLRVQTKDRPLPETAARRRPSREARLTQRLVLHGRSFAEELARTWKSSLCVVEAITVQRP
jgi:hypothetical protein